MALGYIFFDNLWLWIAVVCILFVLLYWLYIKTRGHRQPSLDRSPTPEPSVLEFLIGNHLLLRNKTKIYLSRLVYLQSMDHYVALHTSDKKSYLIRGRIGDLAKQLPSNFIRIHRSYVVNRKYIKLVDNSFVVLTTNHQLPVSRAKQVELNTPMKSRRR